MGRVVMGPGWLSLLILNALTLKTERPNQVKVPIWQVLCSFQIWFPKPKEALSSHRAVAQSRYRLEPIPIALSYLLLYLTVRASAECLRRTCRDVVIMHRRCAHSHRRRTPVAGGIAPQADSVMRPKKSRRQGVATCWTNRQRHNQPP